MNDDVRSYIYGTIVIFLVGVMAWIGFLYLNACGFTLTCVRGDLPVYRTPVPSLIPATMPVMQPETASEEITTQELCEVNAQALIEAWVASSVAESQTFQFTDANGLTCQTTFEEAKALFDSAQQLSSQIIFVGKPVQ
ncbi:MAG: hypothetical protein KF758_02540 [Anaerolineales bacterium]|nr:hypothetical protein [Anaerolineales bacterium]MBX3035766.1 hypothetical protein [Anaerolineales bacterium]